MNKLLSVIIVSYNCESFIQKCIQSVLKYIPQNCEIIVLDNASEDKTTEILEKFKDSIQLIRSKINLGFGKACNQASKVASGEYIFFLNPDTEIEEPIFEELIKFYKSKSEIGIVAPKLVMPDGTAQPSVMNLPTISGAFKELVLGKKDSYFPFYPKSEVPVKVECVFGAAILIHKNIFEKLGGFDEKYFLYYEDIDLCKRVNTLGKQIYYYPSVTVKHIVGGVKSNKKYDLNYKSSVIYNGLIKTILLQIIFKIGRFLKR
jgi:N-acetylglucosaminyl-diphospho-decaprenol L-rhamnosyltransferase